MSGSHALLKRDRWIKIGSFLGLMGFLVLIVLTVDNMLISTLLAMVMAYLLSPLVNSMERMGLKRDPAIAVTFLAASLALFFIGLAFVPLISEQLANFKSDFPKYVAGSSKLMFNLEAKVNQILSSHYELDLSTQIQTVMITFTKSLFEDLPKIVSRSLTVLLLAPFLTFFVLKDGQKIVRSLLKLVPNSLFELTLNLQHEINRQMGQFVRARLFEAGFVGAVVWVGLFMTGFPYATILAIFAAVANLIPYVGPIIGAVPPVAIALINGESGTVLIAVLLVYAVAQIIDILFIIPLVVAKIVNLHPVTVMVAIIIGAQLMGVVGMLISIPLASALKVTFYNVYQHLTDFRSL